MENSRFRIKGIGFNTLGIHYAPDADTILAVALLSELKDGIDNCPVRFFPSGQFTADWYAAKRREGLLFIDIGGLGPLDHHGNSHNHGLSATRLMARLFRRENNSWLKPLLKWADQHDTVGRNFQIRLPEKGTSGYSAHHLLFTSVIRGSSQCRFNPITSGQPLEKQVSAFWKLVDFARFLIRHFQRTNGQPVAFTADGGELLQWSLGLLIAEQSNVELPKFFSTFTEALNGVNASVNQLAEEPLDSSNGFDCRSQPETAPLIRLMRSYPPLLEVNHSSALNFTLLAIAEELVQTNLPYWVKLAMLMEAWKNILCLHSDWLAAAGELRNGLVDGLMRKRCGRWQYRVIAIASDHCQIAQVIRRELGQEVIIVQRSNGQVQITTLPPYQHQKRNLALVGLMERVASRLRQEEAKLLCLEISESEASAVRQIIANWYLADFGGIFNGSLTNPEVPPTRIPLERILEIVCEILSAE